MPSHRNFDKLKRIHMPISINFHPMSLPLRSQTSEATHRCALATGWSECSFTSSSSGDRRCSWKTKNRIWSLCIWTTNTSRGDVSSHLMLLVIDVVIMNSFGRENICECHSSSLLIHFPFRDISHYPYFLVEVSTCFEELLNIASNTTCSCYTPGR